MRAATSTRVAKQIEGEFWRSVVTSAQGLAYGRRLALTSEDAYFKALERAYGKAPQTIEIDMENPVLLTVAAENLSPAGRALLLMLAGGGIPADMAKAHGSRVGAPPAPESHAQRQLSGGVPASGKGDYVKSDPAQKPRPKMPF